MFLGRRRVLDHDVEHEAIELRLGQRIGPFLLDRILRREHEQRPAQLVADAVDRDLIFLHRLEEGRLRLGRRAVDFVSEDHVGEDGAGNEPDLPPPGATIFFDDLGADDVRRHQVGSELDAVELEMHRLRQRLDQQRFGEAGHAAQQAVAAGEEHDQDFVDDRLLSDDGARQFCTQTRGDTLRVVKG
jgi:hypothetical protein